MLVFPTLNKIALVALFTSFAFVGGYADDTSEIARGGGDRGAVRGGERLQGGDRQLNRDRNALNNAAQYGPGGYGGYGGYGGGAVYPQSQYYPSNAQTFPDSAEFQNTYERNQHPPQ